MWFKAQLGMSFIGFFADMNFICCLLNGKAGVYVAN